MTRDPATGAARARALAILAAALLAAAPPVARAEPSGSGEGSILGSLEQFARGWLRALPEADADDEPDALRFVEYGAPVTELKSTGQTGSPFVGIIRYTERQYRCEDAGRERCVLDSSRPVTEIFRYRNGRWEY